MLSLIGSYEINKGRINSHEPSLLVVIIDRAPTGDDWVVFSDWVEQWYDTLESFADDSITDSLLRFKMALLTRCICMLELMSAAEKFRSEFREFMTSDELSTCLSVEERPSA